MDNLEAVGTTQLDIDKCRDLEAKGRPFIITHGRKGSAWFLAFPCEFEATDAKWPSRPALHRIILLVQAIVAVLDQRKAEDNN
jgi:hypothetical protein